MAVFTEGVEKIGLIPPERIVPKPHVRILSAHNLSRQFQYEQRHMVLKITEAAHETLKQVCEAWHVGIPTYLAYAVMRTLEQDTGIHFKWLDPAKGEAAPESAQHEVVPAVTRRASAPEFIAEPNPSFDPLAAL